MNVLVQYQISVFYSKNYITRKKERGGEREREREVVSLFCNINDELAQTQRKLDNSHAFIDYISTISFVCI